MMTYLDVTLLHSSTPLPSKPEFQLNLPIAALISRKKQLPLPRYTLLPLPSAVLTATNRAVLGASPGRHPEYLSPYVFTESPWCLSTMTSFTIRELFGNGVHDCRRRSRHRQQSENTRLFTAPDLLNMLDTMCTCLHPDDKERLAYIRRYLSESLVNPDSKSDVLYELREQLSYE